MYHPFKNVKLHLVFILFFASRFICSAQDSIAFRHIEPWVDAVVSIDSIDAKLLNTKKEVELLKLPRGKFCLINKSDSSIKVDRIDDQMDLVGTEIEINGEWLSLQRVDYSMITCGNSFWTMNLKSKQCIIYDFYIPNAAGGKEVKIRLIGEYNGIKIYSEPWTIHLYDCQIRQAGKTFTNQ